MHPVSAVADVDKADAFRIVAKSVFVIAAYVTGTAVHHRLRQHLKDFRESDFFPFGPRYYLESRWWRPSSYDETGRRLYPWALLSTAVFLVSVVLVAAEMG